MKLWEGRSGQFKILIKSKGDSFADAAETLRKATNGDLVISPAAFERKFREVTEPAPTDEDEGAWFSKASN